MHLCRGEITTVFVKFNKAHNVRHICKALTLGNNVPKFVPEMKVLCSQNNLGS